MTIHPEVLLAVGYAIFLLGAALGLDLLARHSHARSERYRTAGFTYHPSHDAWICPEDQLLVRSEVDHERRLVRYRGRPRSATIAWPRPSAPIPTRGEKSCAPWTPGRTRRQAASTGASHSRWPS